MDKHSSLLGPFVSYEENEVLRIPPPLLHLDMLRPNPEKKTRLLLLAVDKPSSLLKFQQYDLQH